MQTFTFHISGTHCPACVVLTESALGEVIGVSKAKTSLQKQTVEVTGDFGTQTPEEIAQALTKVVAPHGYALSVEKQREPIRWQEFRVAVPTALFFVLVFLGLQKLGIVNLISSGDVTYGTAFVIGVIASLSTCMAVVGGLVLSVSANFAKEGDTIRPQVFFHVGRLVSFFVLGGVIGALGSVFSFGATGTFVLGLLVGLVMLVLGLNLLEIFSWTKKVQMVLPAGVAKRVQRIQQFNHRLTPLLIGIATFFLPCGFTQSMQLYALTTGSFLSGALLMLVFALGTLPVLALISFSSLGQKSAARSGVFYKTAGLIVLFFAFFNIANSLAAIGWIPPLFSF